MDILVALATFCEVCCTPLFVPTLLTLLQVHGPASILVTQALPQPCSICPDDTTSPCSSAPDLPWNNDRAADDSIDASFPPSPSTPDSTPPAIGSFGDSFAARPSRHSIHRLHSSIHDPPADTCVSCKFDLPKDISPRLPGDTPGSPLQDAGEQRSSPVLRSRGYVVVNDQGYFDDADNHAASSLDCASPSFPPLDSPTASIHSLPPNHHAHAVHYLTTRSPASPILHTHLRRSVIRTLSIESLPRGSPSGPLLFGDDVSGYTIAFVFRLSDPRARGHRRTYAFVALGGRDAKRISAIMSRVNKVFAALARWMAGMAEQTTEAEMRPRQRDLDADAETRAAGLTPVSSFLSMRRLDFDPRSQGRGGGKGLPEIVGRESFFIDLHVQFVKLLAYLGKECGG